ncbi:TonB-dependent receptor plug domain-containing protein [Catenovulum sediminis]|uniref:TonB-dependent receptor n=1 Tax=Catenovulum sediminis TaxID=1740262 RepID=A0ABV1RG04_9ALTE|nr:TonB-dependent receptor [Catenovulum sediminis]
MFKTTYSLFCLTCALSYPALSNEPYAEMGFSLEDFYGDEEFISIATGTKKPIYKAPSVASIITSDDIKAMGANTVHQAIESVTGIHVYPSKLNRMNPSYSIRGIHTDQNPQVLVLVNGMRTTYEFTGAKWNIFDVGVNIIDRIEIIKGPGSAVYGADAFSGVINIITKGTDSIYKNEVGAKAGSFNTKASWFNYQSESGDLKYSANAQWQRTDGDSSRIIDSDFLTLLGLSDLSLAPSALDTQHKYLDVHLQAEYQSFYAKLWYLDIEGGTGAGAAQALSNNDLTRSEQFSVSLGFQKQVTDNLHLHFSSFLQDYESLTRFQIFPPGYQDGNGTTFTQGYIGAPELYDTNYGAKLTALISSSSSHEIRAEVGFKYSYEKTDEYKNFGPGVLEGNETTQDARLTSLRGTEHIFIGDNARKLSYISVQDEWNLANDWTLTSGIRYDNYSDFGSTINPRVALVWQTSYNLTSKFLYGSAFRAPSFGDLYSKNNPVLLGNPELRPEQIDTYELAFDYRPTFDTQILLSLFSYQATDLLEYQPNPDGTVQLQNSQQQDGYGSEFEFIWSPVTAVDLKFGYAWQKSEFTNGTDIADAPQQQLDATIQWQINDELQLYLDSYWIMSRERASGDNRNSIDDYNWTNLNLNYTFNDRTDFTLTVRNLFNVNAFEPAGTRIQNDFPLESRGFWLTAKYYLK